MARKQTNTTSVKPKASAPARKATSTTKVNNTNGRRQTGVDFSAKKAVKSVAQAYRRQTGGVNKKGAEEIRRLNPDESGYNAKRKQTGGVNKKGAEKIRRLNPK
jgi:hypothetical protein